MRRIRRESVAALLVEEMRRGIAKATQRIDVLFDAREPRAHGVELDPPEAHVAEAFGEAHPLVHATLRCGDAPLEPDRVGVASRLAHVGAEPLETRAPLVVGQQVREPAVGDARGALHGGLGVRADPDGDRTLERERFEPRPIDAVKSTAVVDALRRPQQPQQLDLLLHPPRAVAEVHAERLELDVVPADAHAEAEPAAAEVIELRRLLRHERGRPKRQHEDRRGEPETLRDRGEVAEHDEDLVPRIVDVVHAAPPRRPVRPLGAEDVLVCGDVRVTEIVDGLPPRAKCPGIGADLYLWKQRTDAHVRRLCDPASRYPSRRDDVAASVTPATMTTPAPTSSSPTRSPSTSAPESAATSGSRLRYVVATPAGTRARP